MALYVTDLGRSREFYEGLLGLQVVDSTQDVVYLRGYEEREWSLKLQRNAWAGLRHIAFKVWDDEDLDRAVELARDQGLPWRHEEDFERPRMVRLQDPFGFPVAFYRRAGRHPSLLQAYHQHRGPGLQRLDHFNLFCPDVPRALRYYVDRLGFRLTEYTVDGEDRVWAAWLQRKGNVHDVALTTGVGPRLHHFAYWVPEPLSVLRAADALGGAGRLEAIERGPGRHGISNAVFLYLRDPDGHRVELYTGDYLAVDPEFEPLRWSLDDPRRQTLWGQRAPDSWFLEGSLVEGFDGLPVPLP
ncbi:MAG: 3,4-dihydroxyphenylacetate 2,3-dioxygenase, partial [Armatimonadota bacterium]|nr:3,4-dihydroxyphenylacetate 2,3-dioxygenase [Armatimonadota bacterium]MDW8155229.1 3,4-dihydroxyphenylacetate 2,3-dioxygenase [Armatimonadota bacterium]